MVYYYLPGLFEFFDFYTYFVDLFQNENYKFRNCKIGAIYGSPNKVIWNGGRVRNSIPVDIDAVRDWSLEKRVNCALTFTNHLVAEQHLDNIYCNQIARLFEDNNNVVVVHSPLLESYIRETYPKYKIVSSTTKCIRDVNVLEREFQRPYERVVLDYNFNKDFNFLQHLPQEHKAKSELLINAVCYPNCPRRLEHYHQIAQSSLGFPGVEPLECDAMHKRFWEVLHMQNTINVDEIYKIYEPMGFHHFKIEGRTANLYDLIEILVYYMVKPEYQLEIRQRLNLIF